LREALTALVLAAAFVASVLNQFHFPWWKRNVARFDRFVLLPYWSFFAPNPGFAGVHLVLRDRTPGGMSEWSEIPLPSTTRWRWLWNPARFERKALQDYLSGLTRSAAEVQHGRALELTDAYIALLAWVHAQPTTSTQATHRQFALLQTVGHGRHRVLQPVFLSREHPRD
jgi:hypothetical protein